MGLQIEIVEASSVIVVTLTGATDLGAIEPLQDAIRAAAGEGQTVVLDITELSHSNPLGGIIDALGPAVAALTLVARPSATSQRQPVGPLDVYTSVDAAIDAVRADNVADHKPTDEDLAAKFDDLRQRYAQMINQCRQLLQNAETHRDTAPKLVNSDGTPTGQPIGG